MTPAALSALLARVASGDVPVADAEREVLGALRATPFQDLGFARVDHHRAVRQGFPEVVLGLGKSPSQIAAISAEIVGRGSTLLVTRASDEAAAAVRAVIPTVEHHADAKLLVHRQADIVSGKGVVVVAAAGTADLPIAEEAAWT